MEDFKSALLDFVKFQNAEQLQLHERMETQQLQHQERMENYLFKLKKKIKRKLKKKKATDISKRNGRETGRISKNKFWNWKVVEIL